MSELPFRKLEPKRTYYGKELPDYRRYKDYLEKDFNGRCGYTDCHQFWFGGRRNFQIDHFLPIAKNPELKTKYSNLVYSCSYVNRAKSSDIGKYLDPCDTDYNEHFYRDKLGNILPRNDSEVAEYMYKKLKLYLKRYSIIWMLEQLENSMENLRVLIENTDNKEAEILFREVTYKYMDYKKYLRAAQ
ncbi:MAG: hypothetical protein KDC67_08205 [Ignavibacteriae bacterium]|nr:hypothetical protein [Ignavibacteriota bacterium]